MLERVGSDIRIRSIRGKIHKSLTVPGSKSVTNRVLLVASLNRHRIRLKNVLVSDDTTHMLNALEAMGFSFSVSDYSLSELKDRLEDFYGFIEVEKGIRDNLIVEIGGSGICKDARDLVIYTGNSGTTMRFLSAFVPLLRGKIILDGDERMRERPIRDLTNALRSLGVNISDNNGYPPVEVYTNGYVRGGSVSISGKVSSQYISGLMLASPYYCGGVNINIQGELVSKPFVNMTSEVMKSFGIEVKNYDYERIDVPEGEYSREHDFFVEPDLTNAFYFLSIPCIVGGEVSVYDVGKNSIQGDIRFIDLLRDIGCEVEVADRYIKVLGDGKPKGGKIFDMNDIPDLVQTMAVISLFADGPIEIRNVSNLRVKETDRVRALCNEIRKLGGEVEEYTDGIKVIPRKEYIPTQILTYNDHRMAMSFALAGLIIDGLVIKDYKCTSKTFPHFWEYLEFIMYS